MVRRHWKRIALFLVGLDVVVFSTAALVSAYMALGHQG
jgi:hypothetical protein